MTAAAKGEAGVEHDIRRMGVGWLLPAWAYPEGVAKLHGLEAVHPTAFPSLIFYDLDG